MLKKEGGLIKKLSKTLKTPFVCFQLKIMKDWFSFVPVLLLSIWNKVFSYVAYILLPEKYPLLH